MKQISLLFRAGLVSCLALVNLHGTKASAQSAPLVITGPTAVPGAVLSSGSYTIALSDSLQDRVVLHIDGEKKHLIFLGVIKSSPANAVTSQPVLWEHSASHTHYLRGYSFPLDYVEFVYPKAEAVAIAKANNTGVIAIDPASESRPELAKLSPSDRQLISLWMLTPTQVGPDRGMEAKHYAPSETVTAATTPAPTPRAEIGSGSQASDATTRTITTATSSAHSARTPRSGSDRNVQLADSRPPAEMNAYRPALKRLPKTGSNLPLLWLFGSACAAAAACLRGRQLLKA